MKPEFSFDILRDPMRFDAIEVRGYMRMPDGRLNCFKPAEMSLSEVVDIHMPIEPFLRIGGDGQGCDVLQALRAAIERVGISGGTDRLLEGRIAEIEGEREFLRAIVRERALR